MSAEERVEDTRILQPGDRVTAHVVGTVQHRDSTAFYIETDSGTFATLPHDATTADRHAKPLPPEPPVGAEVVSRDMDMVFRHTSEDWCSVTTCSAAMGCPANHDTWADVLANFGPVRLLGDPIEAP